MVSVCFLSFFFFNDTATTEIYTLSLHDALPISGHAGVGDGHHAQSRVLDLRLDRSGDDLADAHRELAGAGRVGHRTSWCREPRAGRDAGGAGAGSSPSGDPPRPRPGPLLGARDGRGGRGPATVGWREVFQSVSLNSCRCVESSVTSGRSASNRSQASRTSVT